MQYKIYNIIYNIKYNIQFTILYTIYNTIKQIYNIQYYKTNIQYTIL